MYRVAVCAFAVMVMWMTREGARTLVDRAAVKIVIVRAPWREQSFRHTCEVAATNPWGWATSSAMCDLCDQRPCEGKYMAEKSVSCAHHRAYCDALASGAEIALVFEDDAQLVPQFWVHLEPRLRLMVEKDVGVVWLDHLVLPVANFSSAWLEGTHATENGKSIARRYSSTVRSGLWSDCVWGAGGYLISRRAMLFAEEMAKYKMDEHVVSEEFLCAAAEKFGGFLSSPPLVYQCSNGRNAADSVQTVAKQLMDRRARLELKREFKEMVDLGLVDSRVQIPDYVLEECVVDCVLS
jgi:hypothetical protein